MKSQIYIPIQDVSNYCHISITVLKDFAENKLINILEYEQTECVRTDELEQIKRIIDLYKSLGVNKEGIEIILKMRDQILELQDEISVLKHKLEHRRNDVKYRFIELPKQKGLLIDYDE